MRETIIPHHGGTKRIARQHIRPFDGRLTVACLTNSAPDRAADTIGELRKP